MTETTWWTYVQSVAGEITARGNTAKAVADRAGFDKSAITRWKQGMNADPTFVVKFARAYGRPVVEALTAAGLITAEEADITTVTVGVSAALTEASNEEILGELGRRLSVSEGGAIVTTLRPRGESLTVEEIENAERKAALVEPEADSDEDL